MANRNISKWGAGYIWEEFLNRQLSDNDIYFDKYICVRKLRYDDTYIGYFTVKYTKEPQKYKFGQLMIEFERGRMIQKSIILWEEEKKNILQLFEKEYLLLDNRHEFPWIM